jgi:hypothetical protein
MSTYRKLAHIYDDNWEDRNQFKTRQPSDIAPFDLWGQEDKEEESED